MRHGDEGARSAPKKHRPLPPHKRVRVDLCEPGDIIELSDGRRAVVTAFLNGGPMGRYLSEDGTEGELMSLEASMACSRVN